MTTKEAADGIAAASARVYRAVEAAVDAMVLHATGPKGFAEWRAKRNQDKNANGSAEG